MHRHLEVVEPAGFGRRDDQRVVFRAQGVVGGSDAGLAVAREIGAVDVIENRRAGAELEDETLVGAGFDPRGHGAGAAQDRGYLGRTGDRRGNASGRKNNRVATRREPLLGLRHGGHHALIGFPRGVAKGENAVFQQHQPFDRWIGVEDLGGFFGELKAGHDVGHEPQPAAVKLGAALGGVGLVGEA